MNQIKTSGSKKIKRLLKIGFELDIQSSKHVVLRQIDIPHVRIIIPKGPEIAPLLIKEIDRLTKSEYKISFETLFSQKRLRYTWNNIRKEIRNHSLRDVIDWLDWALSIDTTLKTIRKQVLESSYKPLNPTRYEMPKTRGAFRVVTSPNLRDALIYRTICDLVLEYSFQHKVKGAFFSRRFASSPVGNTWTISEEDYNSFFQIWLKYNQYRSKTLLNKPYKILVVTDITNYFDSISHNLLLEYLSCYGLPRKAIGVLGIILEVLKPTIGHSPNPGIGIPVDEFDCSRELAHVFLFEHDKRVITNVKENNYVRWMDDMNIGAKDKTDARKIVSLLTRSLNTQRLTLNSGKTKFLSPEEVVVQFHLELNDELDKLENKYKYLGLRKISEMRQDLKRIWLKARERNIYEKGNWDKILKRFYAFAIRCNSPILEARAESDLINYPIISDRIFNYFTKMNRGEKLLNLIRYLLSNGEIFFETTETRFFESLLFLDPSQMLMSKLLKFSLSFSKNTIKGQSGKPLGCASAIIASYWFGVENNTLTNLFNYKEAINLSKEVARAWLAVVAAIDPNKLSIIQESLVGHGSDDVARISRFLSMLTGGKLNDIGNYKSKKNRWPLPGKYYDARSWLILEIASNTTNVKLKRKLKNDFQTFKMLAKTKPEKSILERVDKKLFI